METTITKTALVGLEGAQMIIGKVYDILIYSFSSILWGVLIAVVCMTLFMCIIKGWYKDATFSPISYIVGFFLFLLLSFQCILITGSLKILSATDYYEVQIERITEQLPSDGVVSMRDADDIAKQLIDEYPILEYYISGGEFSGYTAKELPHIMADELRSFMRWYIFRRLIWCLGFVVVGAVLVIKSMSAAVTLRRKAGNASRTRRRDDF